MTQFYHFFPFMFVFGDTLTNAVKILVKIMKIISELTTVYNFNGVK